MMLLKSEKYPLGRYQILRLTSKSFLRRFKIGVGIGFWRHPPVPITVYAKWSLRLAFFEIKEWLPEPGRGREE